MALNEFRSNRLSIRSVTGYEASCVLMRLAAERSPSLCSLAACQRTERWRVSDWSWQQLMSADMRLRGGLAAEDRTRPTPQFAQPPSTFLSSGLPR